MIKAARRLRNNRCRSYRRDHPRNPPRQSKKPVVSRKNKGRYSMHFRFSPLRRGPQLTLWVYAYTGHPSASQTYNENPSHNPSPMWNVDHAVADRPVRSTAICERPAGGGEFVFFTDCAPVCPLDGFAFCAIAKSAGPQRSFAGRCWTRIDPLNDTPARLAEWS
jgi:hypothetical protein